MRHCEYTKPNGQFCGGPALRGRDYCFWHLNCVARRARAEKQQATCAPTPLELPPFEDANSIQLSIMMVVDAILRDRIGPRKGTQVLYALQLASNNLKQGVNFQPVAQAAANDAQPSSDEQPAEEVVLCSSYDSLEADYDIREHREQLKATDLDECYEPAAAPEEEQDEDEEEEQLSEEEQFRRWFPTLNYHLPEDFGPAHYFWAPLFARWQREKPLREAERRRQREERRQRKEEYEELWDEIRRDLALALAGEDPSVLEKALADCYERAGLEYETAGWKPASAQLVLFPRKPPASVQQQWYEQRQANCGAAMDKLIADQEAARNVSG